MEYVFGPVPSRRLGKSLGINNIPSKYCSFSCIYCQVGRTTNLIIERREFYPWKEIVDEVVEVVGHKKIKVDYVTFVPDGEPTLDLNLGKEIHSIKREITAPIAVLTNSSLLYLDDVRRDLYEADLVSLKLDSLVEETFRKINRPHPSLKLNEILEGIKVFSKEFKGIIITETMLVNNINDYRENFTKIASFLKEILIQKAYIMVPIRPPAEPWVKPPTESKLIEAYQIFVEALGRERVELLTGYEKDEFKSIIDPIRDLVSTATVHPVRIDYAMKMLEKEGLNPEETIKKLLDKKVLVEVEYRGYRFLIRRLRRF